MTLSGSCGLDDFRATIRKIAPFLGDRVNELTDWDQIKILTVQINRLVCWFRPGLLCIGDAAHAMSPAGGVGINLAIQDAVATANLLARAIARAPAYRPRSGVGAAPPRIPCAGHPGHSVVRASRHGARV